MVFSSRKRAEKRGGYLRKLDHRLFSIVTMLVLMVIWHVVTFFELLPVLYLPSPSAVFKQFLNVATIGYMDATLWQHICASLSRIGVALLFAICLGIPIGVAMGVNDLVHAVLDSIIEFYRPIPPLAYLPLIVIWFGIGEFSKVLLIFLAIFAPIVLSTATGVRRVDVVKIRVAQSLGATHWQIIWHVMIPNALPDIVTGIRIGLGTGWSTLVAAELIAATQGLGSMIQSASQFLMTDLVIAGIVVIALIAYFLEIFLRYLQKTLAPWQGKSD